MATNETVLKALARLEGHQDFETVLTHLESLKASAVEQGATAHELIFIGRAQGIQQVIGDFLKLARNAREILGRRG